MALPGFWLTPESPRWLVSVGRHNEARTVLARYQASGDENADVVNTEMIEISRAIELERGAQAETSYLDMISTKGNRRRTMTSITLGAYGQIVGNSVISYYMPLVLYTVGIEDPTKHTSFLAACRSGTCYGRSPRRSSSKRSVDVPYSCSARPSCSSATSWSRRCLAPSVKRATCRSASPPCP